MTQSERLLHRIAGHITNSGYRYLAHAVDLARELSPSPFRRLTTTLYPLVADRFAVSHETVTRSIARAVQDIWLNGDRDVLEEIAGRQLAGKPSPGEVIYFLATYLNDRNGITS